MNLNKRRRKKEKDVLSLQECK